MRPMLSSSTSPSYFSSSLGIPAHRNRQRHTNQRAASQRCAQVDLSVVGVNNLSNDRESQSRALRLRREKRVEYVLGHIWRHPWTAVLHFDPHGLASLTAVILLHRRRGDDHLTPAFHRLVGVDQQVREQLR